VFGAQMWAGVMKTGQVFVSHTADMARFPEGRPFVQAVLDAVGRAGMAPVDMRYFAARDGSPADYCRTRVGECEVYLAVVGFRYGSVVPGETASYTEIEFQAACDTGVPRLVFLLEEDACPPGLGDADRGPVQEFRRRLRDAGLIVRAFSSGDGLELEVFHALNQLGDARTGGPSGAVPRVWNVPARNAAFTGRDAVLDQLRGDLAGEGRAVVVAQALYGLGGIGKTQIALEYAHRFMADYDLVWWIPAEQPQEISLALAALASRVGVQTSDNAAEAAAAAVEQLRRGGVGRWLLIFDNAEDPADLEPFIPGGQGHILITSRNQVWTHHAEPRQVDVFTRQESITHLMSRVPGLGSGEASAVADAVGNLPLAIEQAGAWLAETGMPAARYLKLLETQLPRVLGMDKPPGYAAPVTATWNLSFDRLKDCSSAAVRLLHILAFCSPGPISMTLLYSDAMIESLLPFDETLRDELMVGKVIKDISRLALVRIDHVSETVQIHRLVQAVIRSPMTQEERWEAQHEVHKILVGARPRQGETDDPANWSTYDLIWAHLGPSHAEECDDPRTRQLLIDWVRYQWKLGEYEASLTLAKRLEDLWTHSLGPDHQQTLHLQFNIANVMRSLGRFGEARDLDTHILERQRAVLGADHPHALMNAGSLAADLRALGYFSEALDSDRETYESFKEQFGADYERTLMAAHNLAGSLRLVGDYFAARRLDQETLDRRRVVLPPDHPYTLSSAAGLALDMRAAGAFREAVDLLRDTWARYRAVLGEDMLETLRTGASLAVSLRKAGQQSEAMTVMRDTYERCKRRYGADSPDAQSCALNLACDYAAVGENVPARELAENTENAYRSSLGESHPFTLVAASNLAIYLREAGDLAQARHMAARTLETMRSRLGPDHPYSLSCAINLANCLTDPEDLAQAEALERQTIARLRKKLGARHPDTLACEANLAITLRHAGRHEEAEQARAQTLEELNQILGPQHPDMRLLQDWRRINRDLEQFQF
jgi:tetratricopeptide (TPR) repeat protein